MSEAGNAFYKALGEARVKFPSIPRTATGQVGPRTYKYADLATVLAAVDPILGDLGFLCFHTVEGGALVTKIVHAEHEGELTSTIPLNLECRPQELGSQITYFRRYAITALLGLNVEDDTDADGLPAASAPVTGTAPAARSKPSGGRGGDWVDEAFKLARQVGEATGEHGFRAISSVLSHADLAPLPHRAKMPEAKAHLRETIPDDPEWHRRFLAAIEKWKPRQPDEEGPF